MRTSVEFLRAETEYAGQGMYGDSIRCSVCNTPTTVTHNYVCKDPDYNRSFDICEDCHIKVQDKQ